MLERFKERMLERLAARLAPHQKSYYPIPGATETDASVVSSYSEPSPYDLGSLIKAYELNVWVNACVKRIHDVVATIPLKIYRRNASGDKEEVTSGPLVDILRNPGRFWSGSDLIKEAAMDIALVGESFWFIDNGTKAQSLAPATVQEIRPLEPQFMFVDRDPVELIKSWTVRMGGREIALEPEFVVHAKTANPFDAYRGFAPLQVSRAPILMTYYLDRYNQLFFKNSARPDIVLVSENALKDDARKQTEKAWKKAYGGFENAHKTAILAGVKPQILGTNAKDGEFINLAKLKREEVLAIFQVPPVMVGVFEYANYANSRQQIQIFFQFTIRPYTDLIASSINNQLIPTWFAGKGDDGLYVEFDYSNEASLQEDILKQATADARYVDSGIKKINEVRANLRLPPVDWGEVPPVRAPAGTFFDPAAADGGQQAQSLLRAPRVPTRADMWKAADRDLIRNEQRLQKRLASFFDAQGRRVLDALDHLELHLVMDIRDAPDHLASPAGASLRVRALSPNDLFAIFDLSGEDAELKELMHTFFSSMVKKVGQAALSSVESGKIFDATDPRVTAWILKKEQRSTIINQTTWEQIRKLLVDASVDNLTIDETARGIRDLFMDMSKSRAEMIARTEMVGGQNFAAYEGYAQSGVVGKKEWLSARDDEVRESHQMVDGDVVDLGHLFANGLEYPGDENGPPEEVINCRCVLLPVVDD